MPSSTSLSIVVFAVTSSIYVGYCNINRQLKHLQTEITQCNRRDFSTRLEVPEVSSKKVDLLLEMHSVICRDDVDGMYCCLIVIAFVIYLLIPLYLYLYTLFYFICRRD
jgi:hypothetical protein